MSLVCLSFALSIPKGSPSLAATPRPPHCVLSLTSCIIARMGFSDVSRLGSTLPQRGLHVEIGISLKSYIIAHVLHYRSHGFQRRVPTGLDAAAARAPRAGLGADAAPAPPPGGRGRRHGRRAEERLHRRPGACVSEVCVRV